MGDGGPASQSALGHTANPAERDRRTSVPALPGTEGRPAARPGRCVSGVGRGHPRDACRKPTDVSLGRRDLAHGASGLLVDHRTGQWQQAFDRRVRVPRWGTRAARGRTPGRQAPMVWAPLCGFPQMAPSRTWGGVSAQLLKRPCLRREAPAPSQDLLPVISPPGFSRSLWGGGRGQAPPAHLTAVTAAGGDPPVAPCTSPPFPASSGPLGCSDRKQPILDHLLCAQTRREGGGGWPSLCPANSGNLSELISA